MEKTKCSKPPTRYTSTISTHIFLKQSDALSLDEMETNPNVPNHQPAHYIQHIKSRSFATGSTGQVAIHHCLVQRVRSLESPPRAEVSVPRSVN